jgi:hypothetical protein
VHNLILIDLIYASFRQNLNNTNIFNNTGLNADRLKMQFTILFPPYLLKDRVRQQKLPMPYYSWLRKMLLIFMGVEIKVGTEISVIR